MDLLDFFINELKDDSYEDTIYLEEGVIPFTPFILFAAAKNDFFNRVKSKLTSYSPDNLSRGIRAKALEFKEKARATVGKKSGKGSDATVYKLTPEQVKVMSEIHKRYGKEISKEVLNFRKNTLAPYALIKRIIKENSRVGSKDIHGMTKEEYMSAVESGKKKIERRGDTFSQTSAEIRKTIEEIDDKLKALNEVEKDFKEKNKPNYKILNKIYKEFGVDDKDLEPYTAEQLRRHYEETILNNKRIEYLTKKSSKGVEDEDKDSMSTDTMLALKKSKELSSGKSRHLSRDELKLSDFKRDDFYSKEKFDTAFGKYLFRRSIIDELKPYKDNAFVAMYLDIIKKLKERFNEIKKEKLDSLVGTKKKIELSDREARIWKKRPGTSDASNDIKDYYKAIKEEDFLDRYINIERSEDLKKAEQEIENEIKRFERKLGKIISKEDLSKLKKYRLINNLISVRELSSPEKLFKSSEEIKAATSTAMRDEEEEESNVKKEVQEEPKKQITGTSIEDIEYFVRKLTQLKNTGEEEKLKSGLVKLDSVVKAFVLSDPEAEEKLLELKPEFSKINYSFRGSF